MGDRRLISKIFIQLFGLVHLFNFLSLNSQVSRIFCEDGLIPIKEHVEPILKNDSLSFLDRWIHVQASFNGVIVTGLYIYAFLLVFFCL